MIIRYIIILLCISLSNKTISQVENDLSVGDTIPSRTFDCLLNQQRVKLSMENLRGKLVILDFWNVWCGTCIEAFPKMQELQKQFEGRLQVILVTNDTEQQVQKILKRFPVYDLPLVIGDSIFNQWFPHNSVPHHVWLNQQGIIMFITDGYNATEKNINSVLTGKKISFHLKQERADFNRNASLLTEGSGRLQKYITGYSVAMKRIEEYGGTEISIFADSSSNSVGFKFINTPLLLLYKIAFGMSFNYAETEFAQDNRVLFLTKKRTEFTYPDATALIPEWESGNIVSYESKWKTTKTQAFQFLQDDLNKFFSFTVETDSVEMPVYSLTRTRNFRRIIYNDGLRKFQYSDSLILIRSSPMKTLTTTLNYLPIFDTVPVIDDTNLDFISIRLNGPFNNIDLLLKELARNGFELRLVRRKILMLVIRDKDY